MGSHPELVRERESVELSAYALSEGRICLDARTAESFLARGLIDERGLVTEAGRSVISLYPMLGEGRGRRRRFPSSFVPAVLSIVASGELSSKSMHFSRYFGSEFFTSIFPGLEAGKASALAIETVKALLELGVAEAECSHLYISKESALSFLSLGDAEMLSYILYPSYPERQEIHRALSLSMMIDSLPTQDAGKTEDLIAAVSGSGERVLERLMEVGLAYEEDGFISACTMESGENEALVISSDFSISCPNSTGRSIFLFAHPVKSDVVDQWMITKSSAKAAFSMGLTPDGIISTLKGLAGSTVPDTVEMRLRSWFGSFSSIRPQRALILSVDSSIVGILDSLPLLSIHIQERIGSNVFVMNPDTEYEWRKVLRYAGFDMVGRTEGSMLSSRGEAALFSPTPPVMQIPPRRMVAEDETKREKLAEGLSFLEKAFVLSGVPEHEEPDVVDGLCYQEKLRIIESAKDGSRCLYIEMTDGTMEIGPVLEYSREEGTVRMENGCYPRDRIWKAALLPAYIGSFVRLPSQPTSGNDSQ